MYVRNVFMSRKKNKYSFVGWQHLFNLNFQEYSNITLKMSTYIVCVVYIIMYDGGWVCGG